MIPPVFVDTSAWLALINKSDSFHNEAWVFYSSRTDKEWSLTDCVRFVVMNRMEIKEAFTNDHHFEQAGFAILLKE